jgi:hypothetical protein
MKRPVLRPTKVTVQSARTAAPSGAPVSASRPEGTSSAITGRRAALIASMTASASSRSTERRPVPSIASTMTSPSASASLEKRATEMPLAAQSS